MRNILVLAVLLVAARVEAATETLHFTSCAQNTGNNATIAILSSAVMVNKHPMQVGDEIAVFNPTGGQCVGAGVWTGSNLGITVWGDDGATPAVDGLQAGLAYKFAVWSNTYGKEYRTGTLGTVVATFSSGSTSFAVDGFSIVSTLTATDPLVGVDDDALLGQAILLGPSHPNPCVSHARIRFTLPHAAKASLALYDMAGREVATVVDHEFRAAGSHEVNVAVAGLRSGVYFYRLTADGRSETRRMTIMR